MENATNTVAEAGAEMNLMERIYTDFTTQMLPAIQEGLVITKDYFLDLFGRYVTFLIVVEVISITLSAITLFYATKYFRKGYKKWGEAYASQKELSWPDKDDNVYWTPVLMTVPALLVVAITTPILVTSLYDLAQVVFVPEIRVYQDLTSFMNSRP